MAHVGLAIGLSSPPFWPIWPAGGNDRRKAFELAFAAPQNRGVVKMRHISVICALGGCSDRRLVRRRLLEPAKPGNHVRNALARYHRILSRSRDNRPFQTATSTAVSGPKGPCLDRGCISPYNRRSASARSSYETPRLEVGLIVGCRAY